MQTDKDLTGLSFTHEHQLRMPLSEEQGNSVTYYFERFHFSDVRLISTSGWTYSGGGGTYST